MTRPAWLRWPLRRSLPIPVARVRVMGPGGRALPVRYVYGGRTAAHTWTAMVHVPRSRHDTAVSVDVLSPRTAVVLTTEVVR